MRIFEIANTYKRDLENNKIAFKQLYTQQEKIKHIIDTKCSDIKEYYIQYPDHYIYKGTTKSHIAFFGDSSKWQRKSANTINLFTSLIDIIPSWRGFPKRTQSLICSTSFNYASSYGNCFIVFPYNDTKIAIGKSDDFFNNFYFGEISGTYYSIVYALGQISDERIKEEDFTGHISAEELKKFDTYIKQNWNKLYKWVTDEPTNYLQRAYGTQLKKIMESMNLYNRSLIQWSDHILSPANNDMHVATPKKFEMIYEKNREVWFSGKFIAVPCFEPHKTFSSFQFDVEYWLS